MRVDFERIAVCLFVVFLMLWLVFGVAPVAHGAQLVQYNPHFGWGALPASPSQVDAGGAVVAPPANVAAAAAADDDPKELLLLEVERALARRGIRVITENTDANYEGHISVFNNSTRFRAEFAVYLKVVGTAGRELIVTGRGKGPNIVKAAEKAAEEAANKLLRGSKIFIVTP